MNTSIGIWSLFLLALTYAQADTSQRTESHTETETTEYGPIVMVVDQLAGMAVDVTDETSSRLQANIEHTLTDITGDLAALTTNAMAEMSYTITDTNQLLLANPGCNADWNLEDFTANVTSQLSDCTSDLGSIIDGYRLDGQEAMTNVQSFVEQMAQLPMLCRNEQSDTALGPLGLDLAEGSKCFMHGMTTINQGLAQAMHNASLLMVRMRRESLEQLGRAQQCSDALVAQAMEYLATLRADCS